MDFAVHGPPVGWAGHVVVRSGQGWGGLLGVSISGWTVLARLGRLICAGLCCFGWAGRGWGVLVAAMV
jgi:hypothetical protein